MQNVSLKEDFAELARLKGEPRSAERLTAHYVLERELALRLKNAPAEDRNRIYGEVYDELFNALPDHPQHRKTKQHGARYVQHSLKYLKPFLSAEKIFAEIGCGDAALSFAAAPFVREAIAIDVQDKLIDSQAAPSNFRFVKLENGIDLPFENNSIDVVSSDQLLEHLHPDDALRQLTEVLRILKPGGIYICTTPSAFTGPHDISLYFDFVAKGLHLREYSYRDIAALFREVGFSRLRIALRILRRQFLLPIQLGVLAEGIFSMFPQKTRSRMARTRLAGSAFGVSVVATK